MDASVETVKVSHQGKRVILASRIKFSLVPASVDLARKLRTNGLKQVLFEHPQSPERLEVWPLDDETAIMERTISYEIGEFGDYRALHQMHVNALVSVLTLSHGAAEVVPVNGFEATDAKPFP